MDEFEVFIPEWELLEPEQLREDPENPNRMTEKQLLAVARSMLTWGFIIPIVTNRDLLIADGHQRKDVVLRFRGKLIPELDDLLEGRPFPNISRVPVVRLDVEEVDRILLQQVLNKLRGQHLPELDALRYKKIIEGDRGEELRKLIGLSEAALRNALNRLTKPVHEDWKLMAEYDVNVIHGEVWELGKHRMMCGSSREPGHIVKLLEGEKIDLVFTSPPYNVKKKYGEEGDDNRETQDYLTLMQDVMALCYEYMKPGRFLCWNLGVSPPTKHYQQASMLENVGFEYYRQIIWQKPGIVFPNFNKTLKKPKIGNYRPNWGHEVIWLFTKGEPHFRENLEDIDMKYQNDIWRINASMATKDIPTVGARRYLREDSKKQFHAKKIHPAVYPKEIVEGGIKFLTAPGDVIFDPFAGTGTNAIACEIHGRKAYMMELLPLYVQVAIDRWEQFTGKKARAMREQEVGK